MILLANVKDMAANQRDITYCGRPFRGWKGSILANPFIPKNKHDEKERELVVEQYRHWLWRKIKNKSGREYEMIRSLAAMDLMGETIKLGCWCIPHSCHTEIISNAIKWVQDELKDDPDFAITVQIGGVHHTHGGMKCLQ